MVNNAVRPEDILITSLTTPRLFNDERDELMLKWNILQVFYGTGTTFCHQGKSKGKIDKSISSIHQSVRFLYGRRESPLSRLQGKFVVFYDL